MPRKIKISRVSFVLVFLLALLSSGTAPTSVESAGCSINSFMPDDFNPPFNTATTLRFSLSGSYPWSINILSGNPVSSPPSAPTNGLVGYWNFDEGSGNTLGDLSGKGNNGTLKNSPTWTAGKYGSALSFDGNNDYVTVPDSNSLTISGGMTIAAWVKKSSNTGTDTIVRKGHSSADPLYYWYSNYNFFTLSDNLRWWWSGGNFHDDTTTINPGTWYQVAVTYSDVGDEVKFYIDGVEKSNSSEPQLLVGETGELTIGNDNQNANYFHGLIDELRVYNRTLSAGEINTMYHGTLDTPPASGTGISDSVTTGNLTESHTYRLTCGSDIQDVTVVPQYVAPAPTPPPINLIPDSLGDTTVEMLNSGPDKPLQDIIDDAGFADNVLSDQKQYQSFTVPNAPTTIEVSYLDSSAPYNHVFGYYQNGNISQFVPLFRKTADSFYPGTPVLSPGQKMSVNVPPIASITFGIRSPQVDAAPLSGLVGHWKFDQGSGAVAVDSSGLGNNGTLKNGTAWVNGKFGKALDFDGSNDYVDVPDSPSLNFGNNGTFTVSAWVYNRVQFPSPDFNKVAMFVSKYPAAGGGWSFDATSEGRLEIDSDSANLYALNRVETGKWQHVVGVQNAGNVRVYVDGVDTTGSGSDYNGNYDNPSSLRIGTRLKPISCCTGWYDGIMDDVRIYNRALSQEEIVSLNENTGTLLPEDISTENSKNTGGQDLALVYDAYTGSSALADDYIIGFEDLYGLGDADYNDMVVRVHALAPPLPPINLVANNTATSGGTVPCGQVQLSWTDQSNDETGFRIYHGPDNNPNNGSLIYTAAANQTSYTYSPPDNSNPFYFISSFKVGSESARILINNNPWYPSSCLSNLSSSDEDIVAINGANIGSGLGNQCGGTDILPANTNLILGDTLKFSVNICNTGPAVASAITVTSTLINLQQPGTGFNARYDDGSGEVSIASAGISLNISGNQLTFSGIPNVPGSPSGVPIIRRITYEAELSIPLGFTGLTARFQSSFNINYNNSGGQTNWSSATPLLPFLIGRTPPSHIELPP